MAGSRYERELKKDLESKGYFVVRSAGSFAMDLLAVKKGRIVGSQVKS